MVMDTRPEWLRWAHEMQSIAQAGIAYGKDLYDIERFGELRRIAAEIVAAHTLAPKEAAAAVLALEEGYATPKVDVRAAVFDREGSLLFVRETSDGRWSLPGGWADVGESAGETAVREVREEAGYEVVPTKLLGLLDRRKHPHPPMLWHVYKVFVRCKLIGGQPSQSLETDAARFFPRHELPELSVGRVTESQIARLFDHYDDPCLETDFD